MWNDLQDILLNKKSKVQNRWCAVILDVEEEIGSMIAS